KIFSVAILISLATFFSASTSADETEKTSPPAQPPRELIYCADLMTHEEREAYRASMRSAQTPQERAELRQAHQEMMRARARERGLDDVACEPLRLRQHGGKP
ncbi:MAG TPA: hypothetical protein VFY78_02610, partial [Gammaproteobacteria bacterium]|nr:hypothetical protein [Gammaproteobacteria bacterium]